MVMIGVFTKYDADGIMGMVFTVAIPPRLMLATKRESSSITHRCMPSRKRYSWNAERAMGAYFEVELVPKLDILDRCRLCDVTIGISSIMG
jgi:hypothetical protein